MDVSIVKAANRVVNCTIGFADGANFETEVDFFRTLAPVKLEENSAVDKKFKFIILATERHCGDSGGGLKKVATAVFD